MASDFSIVEPGRAGELREPTDMITSAALQIVDAENGTKSENTQRSGKSAKARRRRSTVAASALTDYD